MRSIEGSSEALRNVLQGASTFRPSRGDIHPGPESASLQGARLVMPRLGEPMSAAQPRTMTLPKSLSWPLD